jgi:sirohydrochlorin ferrochelatase
MKAVLYIGHGTRSNKGADEAKAFLEKIKPKVPVPIQEISFLELTSPTIEEGFQRCIEKGATDITVVPILLLAAGHMKKDIPEVIASLQHQYPKVHITIQNAFGVQNVILDAIAELVRDEVGDLHKEDGILLVGRGSSDPVIHEAFSKIEKGIVERLGIRVISTCYLAATVPTFPEGLENILKKVQKRVIVVPYLLFPGLLLTEIEERCQKHGQRIIQIDPLSRHKAMEKVVIHSAIGSVEKDAATIH